MVRSQVYTGTFSSTRDVALSSAFDIELHFLLYFLSADNKLFDLFFMSMCRSIFLIYSFSILN